MSVTAKVRFTFILKSGAKFENIVEVNNDSFVKVINTIKTSFREGIEGEVTLNDCVIRLSECAVVDWEEILPNE